ncbi:MAG: regulatory protein RecX [Microbacteriaceae bacterium]
MTQERFTTQGNLSYLPWVVPVESEGSKDPEHSEHPEQSGPNRDNEHNEPLLDRAVSAESGTAYSEPAAPNPIRALNPALRLTKNVEADALLRVEKQPLPWSHSFAEQGSGIAEGAPVQELKTRLHELALRALGRKDYSRKELQRYLESRAEPSRSGKLSTASGEELSAETIAESIEQTLELLGEEGWLNEQRAIEFQLSKSQYQKLGQRGKMQRLQQQGYSSEVISEVLAEEDPDDELENLREIAKKRFDQLSDHDDETARRRLSGFLIRRGFNGSQVSSVIRELFQ